MGISTVYIIIRWTAEGNGHSGDFYCTFYIQTLSILPAPATLSLCDKEVFIVMFNTDLPANLLDYGLDKHSMLVDCGFIMAEMNQITKPGILYICNMYADCMQL